jgi:hypothetical protein
MLIKFYYGNFIIIVIFGNLHYRSYVVKVLYFLSYSVKLVLIIYIVKVILRKLNCEIYFLKVIVNKTAWAVV